MTPLIRVVERIRLTDIYRIREEVRRVYSQDQVLETIATILGLTGPLVRTGGRQLTTMEDIRLFIRDMLLEDMIVSRMNADDVLDDTVATYQ